MPIHLLPPEIASQIAAGEVVERPASVVKELVENALDADARNISVRIEEAGKRLIETRDDGRGIPSKELPLAVSRHATSKLSSAADLFQISTLGFRGEALASIGSVSRMTILSRTAEEDSATRLRVDGGIASAPESVAAPKGTLVRVENLFYNVPARLKFLKTDATERRAIDALMTRYALAYPQVRFRLSHGTQTTLQTAGDGDRRAILAALYGVDTARGIVNHTLTLSALPAWRDPLITILAFCFMGVGIALSVKVLRKLTAKHLPADGGTAAPLYLIPILYGGVFGVWLLAWRIF